MQCAGGLCVQRIRQHGGQQVHVGCCHGDSVGDRLADNGLAEVSGAFVSSSKARRSVKKLDPAARLPQNVQESEQSSPGTLKIVKDAQNWDEAQEIGIRLPLERGIHLMLAGQNTSDGSAPSGQRHSSTHRSLLSLQSSPAWTGCSQ